MTAVEVATDVIDKLRDENRGLNQALHTAQGTIKYSERQLAEKERIIKVLEERVRAGNDGILEMTNRQKDLTIKHLEKQIQQLMKDKEHLEVTIEAIKAEICPKCETKLLMSENTASLKSSSALSEKKLSQTVCPNRVKALERIIEHKDKRIMHLANEVKRLTKSEDELNNKIYRLNKLIPMSRFPSDSVLDILVKENQRLEAQLSNNNGYPKSCMTDVLNNRAKPSTSHHSSNKTNFSKSNERFKTSAFSKPKDSELNLPEFDPLDATKFENEVLRNHLHQLCDGINELKQLFTYEGESLSHGLNSAANEYRLFKTKSKEILQNLNEIVQNILSGDFRLVEKVDLRHHSDDKFVINCLQERLKETLTTVANYEDENKELKERLEHLQIQMMKQDNYPHYYKTSTDRLFKSFSDTNINDVRKLEEIIKDKESQLEEKDSHIKTQQKFIEELQKDLKNARSTSSTVNATTSFLQKEIMRLQTQLNVNERCIQECETAIERLQKEKRETEDRNERLESELHEYKSKAISEENERTRGGSSSKLSEIHTLKKFNQQLLDKIKTLEETIKKLKEDIRSEKNRNDTQEELAQEKKVLQTKLDAADKQIITLEKSVENLQKRLKTVENDKNQCETELREQVLKNNITQACVEDVMTLKNDLLSKEEEIQKLKEELRTVETTALEMNFHRKNLFKEIENLSKILMENEESEDSERRKALYKAALLRSAQALLRLDDNFNLKAQDSQGRNSAVEEMIHQTQVYLTEVSRIHELITSKERDRQEMFKEYFDEETALKLSSPRLFESHVQGHPVDEDLQSSPHLNDLLISPDSTESDVAQKKISDENAKIESALFNSKLKEVQEELFATKQVTTYLLSSCARLENLLDKEKNERAKYERELEVNQEIIKDLKYQLSSRNNVTKRLNNLIEWMRTKECNDEISLDQLKKEIQWLADKATAAEAELCQYKEENCKMRNELTSIKRELVNEKYEKAKRDNELKLLKSQMLNSQTILDETSIS